MTRLQSVRLAKVLTLFGFEFLHQIRRERVANSIHTADADATQLVAVQLSRVGGVY